jgi:MraZ protein
MVHFIGEYTGKIDSKGRVIFPAPFRRTLSFFENEDLVINRGFESCLVLYPKKEWDSISLEIGKLNPFKESTRKFVRMFNNGATLLSLDTAGRILLPKNLMEYAGIDSDVYFSANGKKIEIWSKAAYESLMDFSASDFATLAEEVLGNASTDSNEENA